MFLKEFFEKGHFEEKPADDNKSMNKARIFLLVDLRDFFTDLGSRGRKKNNKKALKKTN